MKHQSQAGCESVSKQLAQFLTRPVSWTLIIVLIAFVLLAGGCTLYAANRLARIVRADGIALQGDGLVNQNGRQVPPTAANLRNGLLAMADN